jgi:hypothetical protein
MTQRTSIHACVQPIAFFAIRLKSNRLNRRADRRKIPGESAARADVETDNADRTENLVNELRGHLKFPLCAARAPDV